MVYIFRKLLHFLIVNNVLFCFLGHFCQKTERGEITEIEVESWLNNFVVGADQVHAPSGFFELSENGSTVFVSWRCLPPSYIVSRLAFES